MSNEGETTDQGERRKRVDRWAIGLVVGTVVLVGFVGCVAGSINSGRSSDNADEAIAQCETRIDRLLKAPTTAGYDSTASGSGTWTVTGTVDSENSFGAKVRASYQCTVVMHEGTATTTVDFLDQ